MILPLTILIALAACGLVLARVVDGDQPVKERPDPVLCGVCGAPTWSASGLCAKCRVPVEPPPVPPPVVREAVEEIRPRLPLLDAEGRLDEDVHCRRCGYNLRGLGTVGACPECDLSISRSLFGDMLRFAEPGWLRRLDFGMRLLIGSIFASIAGGIIGGIVIVFSVGVGGVASMTAMSVVGAVMMLIMFVWFAAVWMLTTPEPRAMETESPLSARSLARWCVVASILSVPIGIVQQNGMMTLGPGAVMTALDAVLLLAGTALGLIALVGMAAGFIYLRTLAMRIPADSLAKQTRTVGWGYVIVSFIGQVWGFVFTLTFAGGAGAMAPGGMGIFDIITSCFVSLASLIFGIWALVLLFLYAGAFRKAREAAERFAGEGAGSFGGPDPPPAEAGAL